MNVHVYALYSDQFPHTYKIINQTIINDLVWGFVIFKHNNCISKWNLGRKPLVREKERERERERERGRNRERKRERKQNYKN